MNNKFDQLAKSVAESVTRRQALKRFGLGLATIALAGFGFKALGNGSYSGPRSFKKCREAGQTCDADPDGGCNDCCSGFFTCNTGKGFRLCVCT